METSETQLKKECRSKGSCGSHGYCCATKALILLIVLLIGGALGYLLGTSRGDGYYHPYAPGLVTEMGDGPRTK
jgi:hypothetical protein